MQVLGWIVGKSYSPLAPVLFLLLILSVPPALAGAGQELFETNCAVCHGVDGTAILPNAPHFAKGERMEKTDAQLLASISEGLNVMPPWKSVLNEAEIQEILTYVRSLAK